MPVPLYYRRIPEKDFQRAIQPKPNRQGDEFKYSFSLKILKIDLTIEFGYVIILLQL